MPASRPVEVDFWTEHGKRTNARVQQRARGRGAQQLPREQPPPEEEEEEGGEEEEKEKEVEEKEEGRQRKASRGSGSGRRRGAAPPPPPSSRPSTAATAGRNNGSSSTNAAAGSNNAATNVYLPQVDNYAEYGNDVEGSLFPPVGTGCPLGDSDWNLRVFATAPDGALLNPGLAPGACGTSAGVPGISIPMIYVGELFSAFAWHVEDSYMYSINYAHAGAPKIWYGAPADSADAL